VDRLLDETLTHVRSKGIRSAGKPESHLKPVGAAFGDLRAKLLTTAGVERYTAERLAAGRARATVNRGLEGLREAFRLGARREPPRVRRVPLIPLLTVENARQGSLSAADFDGLVAALTDSRFTPVRR
jgi:hypothetical protein